MFIKSYKKVIIDIAIYFLLNSIFIYFSLLVVHDSMVAMVSVVWVGIIAWRGGVYAGLLGCFFMYLSIFIIMRLPSNATIGIPYYFNHRVPSFVLGLLQCIIVALVVGYISTLIHRLRIEINLRKKTQNDLEQKVAELDAFGHTVAHDLKNPLMVINVSINALIKEFESSDNAKANKKLAFISRGTKNMIDIIESILMLAGVKKIDQKEFKVFPVSESVIEALKRLEYTIESNGVQVNKPDTWPSAFGYAPWITEVWVNYINNAVKYGGKPAKGIKPVIEIGYDKPELTHLKNGESIRFWVKDNGEGIAQDKAGTLFKEFTRLHTKEHEGHGLGLSIVKTVIDKFNGVVGVESEIGKGSLFYFTLLVNEPQNN